MPAPTRRSPCCSASGSPDEAVPEVAWADLDRAVEARPPHVALDPRSWRRRWPARWSRFAELVRTLRERCPWDREQTHQTLTRHLLEETYEVLEAIDALPVGRRRPDRPTPTWRRSWATCSSRSCFHATLAAERGAFTLADVARGIHDKLVRRHPHVFERRRRPRRGEQSPADWEEIKTEERAGRA